MTEKNSYDLYWRLNEDYGESSSTLDASLKTQGYKVSSKTFPRVALVKLLQRQDCGLLCYETCSTAEVETLATARKLRCYPDSNESEEISRLERELTIKTLMKADENPHFEKFLDLPAELRNRIYKLYDADFPETLMLPTKPPLSRLSRQLRREMLSIFYANHEFTVMFARYRPETSRFRESYQTYIWLSQLSSIDVASINTLQVMVSDKLDSGSGLATLVGHITIRLHHDDAPWLFIVDNRVKRGLLGGWDDERVERLIAALRTLMECLDTVEGKTRLKPHDIHCMRMAVGAAYE